MLFFGEIQITEGLLSILPIKKGLGATAVVEMTCGLVHAIYSLPEWQAVKLTYFTPCFHTWQVYRFLSVLSSHVDRFSPAGPSQKTKKKP